MPAPAGTVGGGGGGARAGEDIPARAHYQPPNNNITPLHRQSPQLTYAAT